ncbi:MAG: hypothetical protein ACI85I_000810 [Arenicella sp.]|jgi:hypothetical protein
MVQPKLIIYESGISYLLAELDEEDRRIKSSNMGLGDVLTENVSGIAYSTTEYEKSKKVQYNLFDMGNNLTNNKEGWAVIKWKYSGSFGVNVERHFFDKNDSLIQIKEGRGGSLF